MEDGFGFVRVGGILLGTAGVLMLLTEMFEYAWERSVRRCGVRGASMRSVSPSRGWLCSRLMFEHLGDAPMLGVECFVCILDPWPCVGWLKGCFVSGCVDVVFDVFVLGSVCCKLSPW